MPSVPPIQPPDESPLAGLSDVPGVDVAVPQTALPWESAAPAPAAVAQALAKAEGIVMPALDGVYGAIADIISSASDPLNRAVAGATRAVAKVAKSANETTAQSLIDLAQAGVPVSFSAPERAAELADPTLKGIMDRVTQVITSPPPAAPAPADPAAEVVAPAADPAPAFVAPGGVYGCGPGSVFAGPEYQYPRPGPLPAGKAFTTCAKFTAGFDMATGRWKWNYDAFGWPGGELDWPPRPADPPIPPGPDSPVYVTQCYCDTRTPVPPVPPAPPVPPVPCDDGTWSVSGDDDEPILHAPGGIGTTPVPDSQSVVITTPDGRCYWAGLPTVPTPLPGNVTIVNDDAIPAGCKAIHGVSGECPPPPTVPPPTVPPDTPTPVPPPSCPEPEPKTCPAPPPPIVIPACPKPEEPEMPPWGGHGAGAGAAHAGFNIDDQGACRAMAAAARAGRPVDPDATVTADGAVTYTPGLTPGGWSIIGTTALALPAIAAIELVSVPFATTVLDQLVGTGLLTGAWARRPRAALPNDSVAMDVGARLALASQAESRTGMPMTYMYQSERYFFQYLNPQYQPGQASIDRMYLADRISLEEWNCRTRYEGNLPDVHFQSMLAGQSLPNDHDVVQARLRGIIPTDAQYLARMRQLGYVEPARAAEKLLLAKQLPGAADLVRMMVRDSADDTVALTYGYDSDFATKFSGQVRQWAEWQGMDATTFKYLWRAHWEIPSNTALYSMNHRLRPDRLEVRVWDNEAAINGVPATELALGPRPPVVTLAEVKRALQINDMAPTWVDPLLAVSYHPITNTDARRAFMIGFISRDELVDRMRDNGYSPADAELLARFFDAERERSITASTGVGSPRWILAAYVDGYIDYVQADQQLREYFPDPTVRSNQLRKADFKASVETIKASVRTSVKRFVMGEIDQARLETDLGVIGVGRLGQARIVSKAIAARDGHKKEPRVAMIIEMYVRGQLSRNQAYDRMYRLGYFDEDINNMLRLGAAKEQERQAVRAAQEANRRRMEAKRNAEGALKLLKEQADAESRRLDAARRELARLQEQIGRCGGTEGGSPGE